MFLSIYLFSRGLARSSCVRSPIKLISRPKNRAWPGLDRRSIQSTFRPDVACRGTAEHYLRMSSRRMMSKYRCGSTRLR